MALKATRASKKTVNRGGRPTAAQAGEAQARILESARKLFLEKGFEATSFDRIAAVAKASKATLYAHYGSKADVFHAVIRSSVQQSTGAGRAVDPALSLDKRLGEIGTYILHHALQPKPIALMRLVIETAHRFPELAQDANRIGWEGGVERVAQAIAAREPGAVERARPAAAWFISLTFAPLQMRALLGGKPAALEASVQQQIAEAISMMAKGGWLDDWE